MAHISKDKTTGQPVLRNTSGRIISRHESQGAAVRARDEMLRQHNRTKTTQARNKNT